MFSETYVYRGIVKWFDSAKGYGFILGPEETDVLVHHTDIKMQGFRYLIDGEAVEYRLKVNPGRGWRAVDVNRVVEESLLLAS